MTTAPLSLLAIAADVDEGVLAPDTKLRATSYFFSAKAARALGFDVMPPTWSERLQFALGLVDVVL